MNNKYNISELESVANEIRGKIIELSYSNRIAHLGSSLSCVDILVAIYWTVMNIKSQNRDRFILSKGHAATALYVTLFYKGLISESQLKSLGESDSPFEEHPNRNIPGIDLATGSLGHGLSVGIGMALAGRIQKKNYRIFCLLSDGECNEGSVWESAMFASAQKLNNIVVFVDFNKWQATGRSCDIMALEPLKEKWMSFGWLTYEINGHDIQSIVNILSNIPDDNTKPVIIIAHTVKGKGVSFMEDDNNWHYRIVNQEEMIMAKKELGLL